MAENQDIWVFSEKPALQAELIAGAHQLSANTGGQVMAVVLGGRLQAKQAFDLGAQRVLWLGELPSGRLVEDPPTLLRLGVVLDVGGGDGGRPRRQILEHQLPDR